MKLMEGLQANFWGPCRYFEWFSSPTVSVHFLIFLLKLPPSVCALVDISVWKAYCFCIFLVISIHMCMHTDTHAYISSLCTDTNIKVTMQWHEYTMFLTIHLQILNSPCRHENTMFLTIYWHEYKMLCTDTNIQCTLPPTDIKSSIDLITDNLIISMRLSDNDIYVPHQWHKNYTYLTTHLIWTADNSWFQNCRMF